MGTATAGFDGGEDIGGAGACQGVLAPFLHFPHFPTIINSPLRPPSPAASRCSAPRPRRDPPPRNACRSRLVFLPIPPCVIFAVFPLRKIRSALKSRTVESKSGAWKMGDIVASSEGAAAGAGKVSGEEDGVAGCAGGGDAGGGRAESALRKREAEEDQDEGGEAEEERQRAQVAALVGGRKRRAGEGEGGAGGEVGFGEG